MNTYNERRRHPIATSETAPAKLYVGTRGGVFDYEYEGAFACEFARLQILHVPEGGLGKSILGDE